MTNEPSALYHTLLAKLHNQTENYEEAKQELDQALKLNHQVRQKVKQEQGELLRRNNQKALTITANQEGVWLMFVVDRALKLFTKFTEFLFSEFQRLVVAGTRELPHRKIGQCT